MEMYWLSRYSAIGLDTWSRRLYTPDSLKNNYLKNARLSPAL
jgi:hypothetical protein